jgi:hypothetical protein
MTRNRCPSSKSWGSNLRPLAALSRGFCKPGPHYSIGGSRGSAMLKPVGGLHFFGGMRAPNHPQECPGTTKGRCIPSCSPISPIRVVSMTKAASCSAGCRAFAHGAVERPVNGSSGAKDCWPGTPLDRESCILRLIRSPSMAITSERCFGHSTRNERSGEKSKKAIA